MFHTVPCKKHRATFKRKCIYTHSESFEEFTLPKNIHSIPNITFVPILWLSRAACAYRARHPWHRCSPLPQYARSAVFSSLYTRIYIYAHAISLLSAVPSFSSCAIRLNCSILNAECVATVISNEPIKRYIYCIIYRKFTAKLPEPTEISFHELKRDFTFINLLINKSGAILLQRPFSFRVHVIHSHFVDLAVCVYIFLR